MAVIAAAATAIYSAVASAGAYAGAVAATAATSLGASAGTGAVVGGIAAGAVNGAIVGAVVGAASASITGGDVVEGALGGVATGAIGGGILGGVSSAYNVANNPGVYKALPDTTSQVSNAASATPDIAAPIGTKTARGVAASAEAPKPLTTRMASTPKQINIDPRASIGAAPKPAPPTISTAQPPPSGSSLTGGMNIPGEGVTQGPIAKPDTGILSGMLDATNKYPNATKIGADIVGGVAKGAMDQMSLEDKFEMLAELDRRKAAYRKIAPFSSGTTGAAPAPYATFTRRGILNRGAA